MKKVIVCALLSVFLLSLSSFGFHKFYMSIYQINYAPEKKMLQITSRIFLDDLNKALEKKYQKKFFLGTDKESNEDLNSLKKYVFDNFSLKVNGQSKTINLLSTEMDGDVLVCYLNIKEVPKIKTLEIYNTMLIECFADQQNITHVTVLGDKKSTLFTGTFIKQLLKY